MEDFELFLAFIALALCFWIGFWLREKKRSKSFAQLAKELYFDFTESDTPDSIPDHDQFPLLNQGRSRRVINKMHSSLSKNEPVIFGYKYTTGSGRNSSTYSQTVAWLAHTKSLPDFQLRPENILHKIGDMFGVKDIDFPERPIFSKKYLLKGEDGGGLISNLFSEPVLSYFEEHSGISVESCHSSILIYFANKRLKPDEIPIFIKQAKNIHSLFNTGLIGNDADTSIHLHKTVSTFTRIFFLLLLIAISFITIELYSKKITSNNHLGDADFSLGSGYAAYEGGDYDQAIDLYSNYIETNPNNKEGYYYRALAHLKLEESQSALNDFIHATKIDVSYFDAFLHIDHILAKELRFEEITRHWDRYIGSNNNNARAYLERGGAFFHAGNREKARDDALMACKLGEQYGCELSEKF
ncbi:MAG: tetratricopeptide repeat protein [Gammaproteobacteria bacterium]|nr:tetratricopeptide repeat protein [Gammaproteobacteria bacterium]